MYHIENDLSAKYVLYQQCINTQTMYQSIYEVKTQVSNSAQADKQFIESNIRYTSQGENF